VRAGLHTGDAILAIDGHAVRDRENFYDVLKGLQTGDMVVVQTSRPEGLKNVPVILTGYEIPIVHISRVNDPGIRAQKRGEEWERGD
jgi:predicted metalloprotease with PDZ domain